MASSRVKNNIVDTGVPANTSSVEMGDLSMAPIEDKVPVWHRMRTKLLLLIALSVLITEILAFVPSIASKHYRWLENHYKSVFTIAQMVVNENLVIDKQLQQRILIATNAVALKIIKPDGKIIHIQDKDTAIKVNQVINFPTFSETDSILGSAVTLFSGRDRFLQLERPVSPGETGLVLIISDAQLYAMLVKFTGQFALISFTIAIVAATLIYLVIYELVVVPMQLIYRNMFEFVREPDNPHRILVPEDRRDEWGYAQQQIAEIETELQQSYVRRKHLADLGLAVSKINHDMRNILASAQLISDHLAQVNDPAAQRLAPKLVRTIDRAISYTQSVLAYGRAQEQQPQRQRVRMRALIENIRETLAVPGKELVTIIDLVPENFEIDVDVEQFLRILTNLCRNAVQAMTTPIEMERSGIKDITISASREGTTAVIDVADTGPGLPAKAKEFLFAPFRGAVRRDGTGLGLAICQELARAHGGSIELLDKGPGTHFRICIPDMPHEGNDSYKKKKNA